MKSADFDDLLARVDNTLAIYGTKRVDVVLEDARDHLAGHVMTAGDVQAWFLIEETRQSLMEYTILDKIRDEWD